MFTQDVELTMKPASAHRDEQGTVGASERSADSSKSPRVLPRSPFQAADRVRRLRQQA